MNNWRDEKYFPLIYLQLYKKQVLHFSRGYFDYTLSFSLSLSLVERITRVANIKLLSSPPSLI